MSSFESLCIEIGRKRCVYSKRGVEEVVVGVKM